MKRYRKAHKKGQNLDVENQAESNGNENEATKANIPVFGNILDLFKSPFIEEK